MTDRCYRSLGLHRGAAESDVRQAYRKKALLLHPDRNPSGEEAFKALHDDYEEALADVKRRGVYRGGLPPFSSSPSPDLSAPWGSAATPAGAAHRFARGAGTAHPPPSAPFFTEKELFGDSIPGGWRDAGARRSAPTRGGSKTDCRSDSEGRTAEMKGSSSASSREAAAADVRWRRAHGARVPVSAYEASGSLPSPQPPSSTCFSFTSDGAQTRASAAAAAGASSSTQAQWDSFLSREHPWQSSSAEVSDAHAKGEARDTGKFMSARGCGGYAAENRGSASVGEAAESTADRVYREAVFLHRRMTKRPTKGGETTAERTRAYGDSSTTSCAKQGDCHQWSERREYSTKTRSGSSVKGTGLEAEPKEKKELQHPSPGVGATQQRKVGDDDEASTGFDKSSVANDAGAKPWRSAATQSAVSWSDNTRAGNVFSAHRHSVPAWHSDEWLKRDDAQQSKILDERRLMQNAYLRYRYTPNPSDVAEMSDMDVYLMASLVEELHHQMQATMTARLSTGPCSCCASAPRARQHLYFSCAHPSVCEGCYALGVSKCPLCGAARAARPSPAPQPAALSSPATEPGGSTSASSVSTSTRASLVSAATLSPTKMPRPGHAPCTLAAEEAEVRPADNSQDTETTLSSVSTIASLTCKDALAASVSSRSSDAAVPTTAARASAHDE
ncbi:hypothetical protein JIQ42_08383 [Leishmania sp. Namibia]|uniref:hypothetical protein n=1 Tax=Leishmania sp. Namibia TaxID=2802991 RepID=UPI001B70B09E|nr:hypothetical protein JIQ42_08383 [Leishmania sp. Namibia]